MDNQKAHHYTYTNNSLSSAKNEVPKDQIRENTNLQNERYLNNEGQISNNDENFLNRKRESDNLLNIQQNYELIKEQNQNEVKNEDGMILCYLCKKSESMNNKKIVSCKICIRTFHINCFLSIGEVGLDNNLRCNDCRNKDFSEEVSQIRNQPNPIDILTGANVNFSSKMNPSIINSAINNYLKNSGEDGKGVNPNQNINQESAFNYENQFNSNVLQQFANQQRYINESNSNNNGAQNTKHSNNQILPPQNNILDYLTNNLTQQAQNLSKGHQNNGQNNIQQAAPQAQHTLPPKLPSLNPQQLQLLTDYIKNEKTKMSSMIPGNLQNNNNTNHSQSQGSNNMQGNIFQQLLTNFHNNNLKNPQNLPTSKIIPTQNIPNQNDTNPNKSNKILNLLQLINNNAINNNPNLPTNQNMPKTQCNISNNHLINNPFYNIQNKQNNITNVNFFNNLINLPNFNQLAGNVKPQQLSKTPIHNLNLNHYSIPENIVGNIPRNMNHNNNYNINQNFNNIYQNQNRPKYPIEDTLLEKNPDKYEIDIEAYERPQFKDLQIPLQLQNKVFVIWDFLIVFKKLLQITCKIGDIRNLYLINYENNARSKTIFEEILICILQLFGKSLFEDQIDFVQDKDLLFFKTVIENPNYTTNSIWDIYQKSYPDFVKFLMKSKKFSLLSDSLTEKICTKISSLKFEENLLDILTAEEKIGILYYLVNSAFDLSRIKESIRYEIEKKNEYMRESSQLENELKHKEFRKKEIEKSEKFHDASYKIEMISKKLEETDNTINSIIMLNPNISTNAMNIHVLNKQKKELENERERYKSIIKENHDIELVKEKIIEHLEKIKMELNNFNITSRRLLGLDYLKNEYFFFKNIRDKIYIKEYKKQDNLENNDSENHIQSKKSKIKLFEWKCLDSREDIEELMHKLLDKGMREKKLKHNLKKILQKKMSFENDDVVVIEESVMKNIKEENDINIIMNNHNNSLVEENLLIFAGEILKRIEEKFTDYLIQFDKEWESPDKRNKWREFISKSKKHKNYFQSLIMLNIRFKNPYRAEEAIDDGEVYNKEAPKFSFISEGEDESLIENLYIYEFDNTKANAPKGKI